MTHDTRMAATEQCEFCSGPSRDGGHRDGCPALTGTPESKQEWKQGYQYGFDDNYIESWRWRYYKKTFILGYKVGYAAINQLVEAAYRHNYRLDL